jgi:hypothetical protein
VFGDFCSGTIWGATAGTPWTRDVLLASGLSISTFGEDVDGELYVADLGGTLYRIGPPQVTVNLAGAGTGSVSGPDGMDCPGVCSVQYEPGSLVTLTALPAPDSLLAGWSGACGGPGTCDLTMDGDKVVTATFNRRPFLQFSAASYSVNEGSNATITVQRLVSTAGTVMVNYAVQPGSATAPPGPDADYGIPATGLTGTLTFTPGQSSRTFSIPTINDTRAEAPETILLALSSPTGGAILGAQSTAILTIQDRPGKPPVREGRVYCQRGRGRTDDQGQAVQRQERAMSRWTSLVTGGTTATAGADFTIPAP